MENKPLIDKDLADVDLAWRILDRIEQRCELNYCTLTQFEVVELILKEIRKPEGRHPEPEKEIANATFN